MKAAAWPPQGAYTSLLPLPALTEMLVSTDLTLLCWAAWLLVGGSTCPAAGETSAPPPGQTRPSSQPSQAEPSPAVKTAGPVLPAGAALPWPAPCPGGWYSAGETGPPWGPGATADRAHGLTGRPVQVTHEAALHWELQAYSSFTESNVVPVVELEKVRPSLVILPSS